MKKIIKLLLLPALACLALYALLLGFDSYVKSYGQEKNITFIIPKASGLKTISAVMAENKIVPAPWVFEVMVLRFAERGKLKAGEYELPHGASAYDAMMKMARGDMVVHKVTIPEGWTTSHIYSALQAVPELTGAITPLYHEGELLPQTYRFERGETRDAVLARMYEAMDAELAKIVGNEEMEKWRKEEHSSIPQFSHSPIPLLTLASIVEKETRIPDERPRVAAVYLNRLRIGMKLQADPTVIYALTSGQRELGRLLLLNDLGVDSPYNTYRYVGLPPGPICNPGKAAIEAAAHPLHTNELYFVADGTGGHRFAATEKEHGANVAAYRKWEAQQR